MREMQADVLVVGGGLGGVAAALGALRAGRTVLLTEQYAWLGGQLTSQAVPPDEHSWVEQFGVTRSYRALRDEIHADVLAKGYDPDRKTFTQYYGSRGLDAATLLIPQVGEIGRASCRERVYACV